MNLVIRIYPLFGGFCANAESAAEYRAVEVEPSFDQADQVIMDFDRVHNMNSSFCNALIAGLVERKGPTALRKLRFRNCRGNLQPLIQTAIEIGLSRSKEAVY